MNSSDQLLCSKIARKLSIRLKDSGYRVSNPTYNLARTYSFKSILSEPQSDIQITDTNTFSAKLDQRLFSECLQKDFAYGRVRCDSMLTWVATQGVGSIPGAWLVVSSYYALFFLASEILRIGGKFIVYFDSEQISDIRSRAPVSLYEINKGTWCGSAFSDSSGEVKVRFGIRNGGHHEQIWIELRDMLSKCGAGLNADSKSTLERVLLLLGDKSSRWASPNTIRNQWNYSIPELFGRTGEDIAEEFRKQCGREGASSGWGNSKKLHPSQANEILGVNYSLMLLSLVYQELLTRLFSDQTLKEIRGMRVN